MPEQTQENTFEQAILEAAEKLFLEKGFAMTSTTEIAREAGCNQALVHYYFRTKAKLFDSVFEKKARLFFSVFLQIDESGLPFEERLKRKIETHFDMLKDNPQLPFLIINELVTNPKRLNFLKDNLHNLPQVVFNKIQMELQLEIEKGNIRPISVFDLAISMVSLNAFMFLARPVFKTFTNLTEEEFNQFIEHRKQENVRMILNSLRP
jgi:TetR/AcrR family transcriptional regulator